jgi:hypothetical protein
VGANNIMPAICWTRYFMKAQGYGVKDNILFQENKSSILLENNGKASSSKRTKHINIGYLFITDRVSKEEVSVVWCPTGDMIGDYATKPLQEALLRKFRYQIMGVNRSDTRDQKRPMAVSEKQKQTKTILRKAM